MSVLLSPSPHKHPFGEPSSPRLQPTTDYAVTDTSALAPGDSVAKSLFGAFAASSDPAPQNGAKVAKAPLALRDVTSLAEGGQKVVHLAKLPNGRSVVVSTAKMGFSVEEDILTKGEPVKGEDAFVTNKLHLVQFPGKIWPEQALLSKPMLGKGTAFEAVDGFDTQYATLIPKHHPHREPYKNGIMTLTLGAILPILSLYKKAVSKGMHAYIHGDYKELQLINDTHKKNGLKAHYIRRKVTDLPGGLHPNERTLEYCDPRLMGHKLRYHIDDLRGLATILSKTLYRALLGSIFEGEKDYCFAKTQEESDRLSQIFNEYYRGSDKGFFEQLKQHGFLTAIDPRDGGLFGYAKAFHLIKGEQYLKQIKDKVILEYPNGDQKRVIMSLFQSLTHLTQNIRALQNGMNTLFGEGADRYGVMPKLGPLTAKQKKIVRENAHLLGSGHEHLSEQTKLALIAEKQLIANKAKYNHFFETSQKFTLSVLEGLYQGVRRYYKMEHTGPFGSPLKAPKARVVKASDSPAAPKPAKVLKRAETS
jgi:hypothetical protein